MSCVLVTLIIKHNEMPCGTGDCTPKRKSSVCLSVSPPHCFSVYSACQPVCLSTSPSVCPPVSVSPQSVHLLNASSMALGGGSRQRCVSAAARLPPVFLCAIAIYAPQSAPPEPERPPSLHPGFTTVGPHQAGRLNLPLGGWYSFPHTPAD